MQTVPPQRQILWQTKRGLPPPNPSDLAGRIEIIHLKSLATAAILADNPHLDGCAIINMNIHPGLVTLLSHHAGRQQPRPPRILAASIGPLNSLFSVLG